jgi:hypothetical protein
MWNLLNILGCCIGILHTKRGGFPFLNYLGVLNYIACRRLGLVLG